MVGGVVGVEAAPALQENLPPPHMCRTTEAEDRRRNGRTGGDFCLQCYTSRLEGLSMLLMFQCKHRTP